MTALLIGKEQKEQIASLIKHANDNKIAWETLVKIAKGETECAGNQPGSPYNLILPLGYSIVFTIEEQISGNFKHISIALLEPITEGMLQCDRMKPKYDLVPSRAAVTEIIKLFGYTTDLNDCIIQTEICGEESPGGKKWTAINIWEPIDGDWSALDGKTVTEH